MATTAILFNAAIIAVAVARLASGSDKVSRKRAQRVSDLRLSGKDWMLVNGEYITWER